jgi:Zn-dependent peptidase ImmA (M78 family)
MAGLSKGMSVQDIAKKYNVSVDVLKQQLKKGIKVEREHTNDAKKAARIAMDHLSEDPKYYTKLDKIGLEENLNKDLVKEFMKHVMTELELDNLPPIKLSNNSQEAIDMRSWGGYQPSDKSIYIITAKRHPADVFRTLAHELVHYKQDTEGRLKPGSGMTGSDDENEANSRAAVIMRNFAQAKPNLFEHLNNEGKFGNYLFGDEESGVKIGWYDSEKEKDTPAEKALFDLLKKYADSTFPEYTNINLDDLIPTLKDLKDEYPEILITKLKDDDYIYRGTTLSYKELDKLEIGASTVYFEQGYIIKDQTYSSKRQLSSWSTDYYPAATFAITSSNEKGGYPVVMRAKASDANLYFNPEFLNKLSTQSEKEVLNTTNPIPVDIMVINLDED